MRTNYPIIKNEKVFDIYQKCFTNDNGGLHVIISPPGAGKSTYLREYCNMYKNEIKKSADNCDKEWKIFLSNFN